MKLMCLILLLVSSPVWAQKKVAVVKLLRGEVSVLTIGKTSPLKADDWVETGAVIKTANKSFVKLVFIDKSQMNIGPNSEMKIEQYSDKDSGVIDLVKGKIRSQVTKDYLKIQDKNKSKLFIKTPNAVMGVRGTDFMIATNGKNTSTVLFEGEIAFNRMNQRGKFSTDSLERMVDRGMRLFPGEFSVVERERPQPTVPALMNIQQRDALENNDGLSSDRAPSNASADPKNTVVPAGLDGKVVSNDSKILNKELAEVTEKPKKDGPSSKDPDGYVKGTMLKPANGSFLHVESGVIIPPGPGSLLDDNSNTYIAGQEMGTVNADGTYVPPENVEITADGKVLITVTNDTTGAISTQEIQPPTPTMEGGVSLATMDDFLADNTVLLDPTKAITNDVIGAFTPRGILDISEQQKGSGSGGGISPSTSPGLIQGSGLNIQVNKN